MSYQKPDLPKLAAQLNAATKAGEYFKAMHLITPLSIDVAERVARTAGYEVPPSKYTAEATTNLLKLIGKAVELRTAYEKQRGGIER
jgi:hypothetical protein